ncbi:unnamed protein product, partial [Ectocarpus sp. 13 AM-2016]
MRENGVFPRPRDPCDLTRFYRSHLRAGKVGSLPAGGVQQEARSSGVVWQVDDVRAGRAASLVPHAEGAAVLAEEEPTTNCSNILVAPPILAKHVQQIRGSNFPR